jgi:hypothetical protein
VGHSGAGLGRGRRRSSLHGARAESLPVCRAASQLAPICRPPRSRVARGPAASPFSFPQEEPATAGQKRKRDADEEEEDEEEEEGDDE